MRTGSLLLSVVVLLATAQSYFGQDAKTDAAKIQGTWEIIDARGAGKKEFKSKGKITFAGDRMSILLDEKLLEFTFKLDEKTNPKSIDFTALDGPYKDQTNPGIYQLEADKLQLCLPNQTTKTRPKEFKAGQVDILFTLKRAKTDKK